MSHNVSVSAGSSQSQETSSSGYRTQEEVIKTSSSGVRNPVMSGMSSEREKLKEELLRQYESGQLKASVSGGHHDHHHHHHGPTILSGNSNRPRQIPTIEEYRQTAAVVQFRKPVSNSAPYPTSLHFPDLSRPPPGYIYAGQQAVAPSIQINHAPAINPENYEVYMTILMTVNCCAIFDVLGDYSEQSPSDHHEQCQASGHSL